MRRLFIMRKDLHMSPGKLAAQVAHCAEAYWTRKIKKNSKLIPHLEIIDNINDILRLFGKEEIPNSDDNHRYYNVSYTEDSDIFEEYISGRFVKTICEARNKRHLLKAVDMAEKLGLVEDEDYGLIYDACFTELEPEEDDGTTLTGIWFKPLDDDIAHSISKKYQLYK